MHNSLLRWLTFSALAGALAIGAFKYRAALFPDAKPCIDGTDCANVPYSLYQGETKIEDGITDESGGLLVSHITGTQDYSVRLASGSGK